MNKLRKGEPMFTNEGAGTGRSGYRESFMERFSDGFGNNLGIIITFVVMLFIFAGGAWWAVKSIDAANARATVAEKSAKDSEDMRLATEKKFQEQAIVLDNLSKKVDQLEKALKSRVEARIKLSEEQKRGLVKSASIQEPIKRKLASNPVAFGYKGEINEATVKSKTFLKWLKTEAKSIAMRAGFLDVDGNEIRFRKKYFGKLSVVLGKTDEGQEIIALYSTKADGRSSYDEPDAVYLIAPEGQSTRLRTKDKLRYYEWLYVAPKSEFEWCFDTGDPLYQSEECEKIRSKKH